MFRPLTQKLVLLLILASSLATLFFTTLNFYRDFQSEKSSLNAMINQVAQVYRSHLSDEILAHSNEKLRNHLESILHIPHISKIELYSSDKKHVYSFKKEQNLNLINRHWLYKYIPDYDAYIPLFERLC